jgi:predicted alpha/beta-hydrolase family hydrolase
VTVILGHGAGAGQGHPFMVRFAVGLSALGLDAATFNFSYTEAGRKAPDRGPVLEATFAEALEVLRARLPGQRLVIGGKSMGGRIASQLAARDPHGIDRLVFLGYPLHPPGKPSQLRSAHLPAIGRPMLFLQGERDAFGTPDELRPILAALSPSPTLVPVKGGDHSFAVPKRGGVPQEAIYETALLEISRFIH